MVEDVWDAQSMVFASSTEARICGSGDGKGADASAFKVFASSTEARICGRPMAWPMALTLPACSPPPRRRVFAARRASGPCLKLFDGWLS